MSKIFAGLSKINGIAASVLKFIPGGQPFAAIAAASSAFYGGLAQLTSSPPLVVPSLDDYTVGPETPYPYVMGRVQVFGNMIHREAHGRTRQDVPNPWLTETYVYSGAGPVQSIQTVLANSNTVTFDALYQENGYYDKYLRHENQLGATPEANALDSFRPDPSPPTINYWNSTRKLSGLAAGQFSLLLDDEETHFRSGPPKFSVVMQGVKCYDMRLDGTYPGGVGSHRIDDESTFTYSQNPILHAMTYAYGRYQNGKQVCGAGIPIGAIDVESFRIAANVADTNGWTIGGIVYENGEDGEIWNNLKLILQAGGAFPVNSRGILRCIVQAPQVTVDTITDEDLEGPASTPGMTPFDTGFNTVIPKYMSEANDWSYVASDAITVSTLETAQGETRTRERQFALVTDKDQAAELGLYAVYDSVEIQPIQLTVGRRFISYDVGDAFDLEIDELGLTGLVGVVVSHTINVETGQVQLGLRLDTAAKHAFILGATGTAPPHPALVTNEDLDLAENKALVNPLRSQAISAGYIANLASGITSTDDGSDCSIDVPAFTFVYGNSSVFPNASVNASSISGLAFETTYYLCYDDSELIGGDITLIAETTIGASITSQANPYRHHIGIKTTLADGGADTPSNSTSRPGNIGPDEEWDGEKVIPQP